jgi:hypothetical protein
VKDKIHEENVAAMKADVAQLKAELAQAHADRKGKLQDRINQLDARLQRQLQSPKRGVTQCSERRKPSPNC